jgi:DNA polymerase III epsilon subunit family exonuclease
MARERPAATRQDGEQPAAPGQDGEQPAAPGQDGEQPGVPRQDEGSARPADRDGAGPRPAACLPGEAAPGPPLSGLLPAAPFLPAGDLVVVDIETTGWLADAASITEIGAVRLSRHRPTAEFSALVNPGVPIPAAITELTGITDAMVSGAPPVAAVLAEFLRFASGAAMVAHNAPFDVGFLAAACHDSGIDWPPRAVIDTAALSRMVLSPAEVDDHRLATLSGHFGVRTGPCHRALADARATAGVLAGLLGLLARGPRAAVGPPVYRQPPDANQVPAERGRAPSRYDVAATGTRAPTVREAAMVTAIVLIKADVASIPETAATIAQIEQVSEVYSVTGEFDLVAMVRVRSHDELSDVIPGNLNKVTGVTHTETHIAFRAYSRHDLDAAFSIGYPESS